MEKHLHLIRVAKKDIRIAVKEQILLDKPQLLHWARYKYITTTTTLPSI